MRREIIFAVFLLFSFSSFSQIKILFDATKAETAGNADWTIDADTHNLGYSTGPAIVGAGDEANPQRFPTPAQSTVTSSTVQGYWEGGISAWGIDMVKKGYEVETLPYNVAITYGNTGNTQDLSNYKVFVVDEPNIQFTATEKTAILQFVQNGGGLFIISDHDQSDRNNDGWDSPHIWNDLFSTNSIQTDPFGITFDYVDISPTSSNVNNLPTDSILHGIMGNVTEVMWSDGTTMTLTPSSNSTVTGLIYTTGSSFGNTNVLVARCNYGQGRVVAMGDSSPADDGSGDSNDGLYDGWITDAGGNHEKLIVNATIWLASSTLTGISNGNIEKKYLYIFPNPSNNLVNISIPDNMNLQDTQIYISDIAGKKVLSINNLSDHSITVNKNQLARGMYFVQLFESGALREIDKLEIY
jgi:hypothetical protein